jgi:hypothetical protein
MVQQGATIRQVDAALGAHHKIITISGKRCRLHGTPARVHAGGRQCLTTPAQDQFLVVLRACRAWFSIATSLRNGIDSVAGAVILRRRYEEGCVKAIIGREDLAYVSP